MKHTKQAKRSRARNSRASERRAETWAASSGYHARATLARDSQKRQAAADEARAYSKAIRKAIRQGERAA